MNLPWDKSYFKICFYAIFTFICIYIAKNAIDGVIYTFVNLEDIYSFLMGTVKKICSVFSIIIAGFVIAYIIKPFVCFTADKTGLKKTTSVGVVFILLAIGIGAAAAALIYGTDYKKINTDVNECIENINAIYVDLKTIAERKNLSYVENIINAVSESLYSYVKTAESNIINISRKILGKIVTFLLSIVVAFYMLKDEEKIADKLKEYSCVFISEKYRNKIYRFLKDADSVFSGYMRGQLTDGFIMAALISLALSIIKVPFSVAIGILSGFLNIIPYFGSITGFCLATAMGLISGEPIRALYAAVLIAVLQQIDAVLISPKIVGESVKLSPVMIIISLAVAGKLFGITGMIFAVPVVAVAKLRLDRLCRRDDENAQ